MKYISTVTKQSLAHHYTYMSIHKLTSKGALHSYNMQCTYTQAHWGKLICRCTKVTHLLGFETLA